jgi:hypothetical protein
MIDPNDIQLVVKELEGIKISLFTIAFIMSMLSIIAALGKK